MFAHVDSEEKGWSTKNKNLGGLQATEQHLAGDVYPMSWIDDVVDQLGNPKFISDKGLLASPCRAEGAPQNRFLHTKNENNYFLKRKK